MTVQQYRDLLLECLVTLRHGRVFVSSREKMHPTGVELYDQLTKDIEGALKGPGPEGPYAVPEGPPPPFAPVLMLQGCMVCGGHHGENMPCPQLAPTCNATTVEAEHGE